METMHPGEDSGKHPGENRPEARLEVKDLSVAFALPGGEALAVDRASFSVARGETLALVGESGCGKSVTCLALMRLLPTPPARLAGGSVILSGRELTTLSDREMRNVRGGALSMIFQEPMTSFDPVYTMGEQLAEAVYAHGAPGARGAGETRGRDTKGGLGGDTRSGRDGRSGGDVDQEIADRVADAMASVGLPDPKGLMTRYPHELSGGMKQRAMIATALLGNPEILLCDEPTTALDVTIQAQIIDLLARLRDERGMSMLFITHNLGLVAELARRAAVMYAGRIVEISPVADLFAAPLHPYTKGLLASIPRLSARVEKLSAIRGVVPGLGARPAGCSFAPRCDFAQDICREREPDLEDKGNGRLCACHFAGEF